MAKGKTKKQRERELELANPELEALQLQMFAESRQNVADRPIREAREAAEAAEKSQREEQLKAEAKAHKEKEEKELALLKKENERRAEADRRSDEKHRAEIRAKAKETKERYEEKEKEWARIEQEAKAAQVAKVRKFREEMAAKERVEQEAQRMIAAEEAGVKESARRAALTNEERVLEDKEEADLQAAIDNDSLFGDDDSSEEKGLWSPAENAEHHDKSSSGDSNDDMSLLFGEDTSDETGLSSPLERPRGTEETHSQHKEVPSVRDPMVASVPDPLPAQTTTGGEDDDIEARLMADLEAEIAAEQSSTQQAKKQTGVDTELVKATRDQIPTLSILPVPDTTPVPVDITPTKRSNLPQTASNPEHKPAVENKILAKNQTFVLPDGTSLNGEDLRAFTPKKKSAFKGRFKVINTDLTADEMVAIYKLAYINPAQETVSVATEPQLNSPPAVAHQELSPRPQVSPKSLSQMSQQYKIEGRHPNIPQQPYTAVTGQAFPGFAPAPFQVMQDNFHNLHAAYEQQRQQDQTRLLSQQVTEQSKIHLTADFPPRATQKFELQGGHSEASHTPSRQMGYPQWPESTTIPFAPGPMLHNIMQPGLQPYLSTYLSAPQTIGAQAGPFTLPSNFQAPLITPYTEEVAFQNSTAPNYRLLTQNGPFPYSWPQPIFPLPKGVAHQSAVPLTNDQLRKRPAESLDFTNLAPATKKQRLADAPHFNGVAQNLYLDTTGSQMGRTPTTQQQLVDLYAQEQQYYNQAVDPNTNLQFDARMTTITQAKQSVALGQNVPVQNMATSDFRFPHNFPQQNFGPPQCPTGAVAGNMMGGQTGSRILINSKENIPVAVGQDGFLYPAPRIPGQQRPAMMRPAALSQGSIPNTPIQHMFLHGQQMHFAHPASIGSQMHAPAQSHLAPRTPIRRQLNWQPPTIYDPNPLKRLRYQQTGDHSPSKKSKK